MGDFLEHCSFECINCFNQLYVLHYTEGIEASETGRKYYHTWLQQLTGNIQLSRPTDYIQHS